MKKFFLFLNIIVVNLSGCSSSIDEKEEFVQERWTKGISRLGSELESVYPPTEDIQIGDVYAVEISQNNKKYKGKAFKLGQADGVYQYLEAYYGKRMQLPATVFANDEVSRKVDQGAAGSLAFRGRFQHSLPLTAFPDYTLASGRLFNFSASFPGKVFAFLFGFSGGDATDLTVSVRDNSTYGLPAYEAQGFLNSYCAGMARPCDQGKMRAAFEATYGYEPQGQLHVRMVSRVHVTRTLNFTYNFQSAYAAKAVSSRLDSMKVFADKAASLTTPADAAAKASKATPDAARDALLAQLIASLNKDIAALAGTEGGAMGFAAGSYDGRSMVLTQSFARPLTFAYGGVWLGRGPFGRGGKGPTSLPPLTPLSLELQTLPMPGR